MNTAWSLYYMYVSGTSIITNTPLPWGYQETATVAKNEVPSSLIDFFSIVSQNNHSDVNSLTLKRPYEIMTTTPSYFHHLYHTSAPQMVMSIDEDMVLKVIDKKITLGTIEMRMVAALALSWIIVCMCTMHNSVHTMNRIVYVTATLPLLILAILFARVIHLPGAWEGINLLYPTFDRIMEKSVWQNAVKLIFFDMQVGVGVLISISKHNRFHTNVFRDAVLMVTMDMIVSLLAAAVAFGFLGFLAFKLKSSDIRAMCRGQIAPHLLWDQILRSMTYMQPYEASIFSFMYQLMLALGAIECTFTLCESFASALDCKIPFLKNRPCFLRGLVAIVLFFLTIPCCFQSGVHVYNLLVHYSMHWNIKIVALCQFAVIVFIYGVDNLFRDISLMLRLPPTRIQVRWMRYLGPTGMYIKHAWTWMCPTVVLIAICFDLFIRETGKQQKKVGDSQFWHFLSLISIIPLPAFILYYIYKKDKEAFKATEWKALQMPYDDSTICTTLLSQETELDNIVTERPKDCIPPPMDAKTKAKYDNPVEFSISKGPYFDMTRPALNSYTRLTTAKADYTNSQSDQSNKELLISPESESEIDESDDEEAGTSVSSEHSDEDETLLLRNNPSPTIAFTPFANLNVLTGQPGFSAAPLPAFSTEPRQPEQIKGEAPPEYKE
uniref:Uncharacterized protein n=1 Tax=Panagrolaimus sp. ES5 TaxID=591445 RepID=A0AC34GWJ0_9BILA